MANRQQEEILHVVLEHLDVFYPPPPCSYLLAQTPALLKICNEQYGGSVREFETRFIKPVHKLLETLQRNGMPIIHVNSEQQMLVLVHLTEPELPEQMEPGEVVIWARKSAPGTLCMKHTRYVTKNGHFQLPKPHYESTKMKVEDKDITRCLTRSYFSELRKSAKDNGAERYSLMMRLIIARNTGTKSFKSLDYDKVVVKTRRGRTKTPVRRQPTQESGDDPVAKSTESQELQENLRQYRDYRASRGSEGSEVIRSPSPTGTGASDYTIPERDTDAPDINPERGSELEAITSSSEDEVEESIINIHPPRGEEPEAQITLQPPNEPIRPMDGYVDSGEAVGPGETRMGEAVAPPVAAQPIKDEYVSPKFASRPDTL